MFSLGKSSTETAADLAKQKASDALDKRVAFLCKNRLGYKKEKACKRSNSNEPKLDDFGDIDDVHHCSMVRHTKSGLLHRGKMNCKLGD